MAEENNTPLFEQDDFTQQPLSPTGVYPFTKTVVGFATDTAPTPDKVDYTSFIDEAFKPVAASRNESDRAMADKAAQMGSYPHYEAAVASLRQRMALEGQASFESGEAARQKMYDITLTALENIVSSNEQVARNNPDAVAKIDRLAPVVTGQAAIEQAEEDGRSWTTWGKGIAHAVGMLSLGEGYAHDKIAVEMGVPKEQVRLMDGQSSTMDALKAYFQSLPEKEKGAWLEKYYSSMKSSLLISDLVAAHNVLEVARGDEGEWDGTFDVLQKVGIAAGVLGIAGAGLRSARLLKSASSIASAERTLAAAGGKGALVLAEAAKMERLKAAGVVAGELTGASAVMDLGKFVTFSASKLLPESVTTSVASLQKTIINDTSKLLEDLRTTLSGRSAGSDEIATAIAAFERSFSKADNPNIHNVKFNTSDDGLYRVANVVYQADDGRAFRSAEAATEWAKVRGLTNFKVVPDTTNTNFLIDVTQKGALLKEKEALEAQLLEKAAKATARKAAKKPAEATTETGQGVGSTGPAKGSPAPASLKTSKPTFSAGPLKFALKFEGELDKAIYQVGSKSGASKSDKEVLDWIKAETGMDEAQIRDAAASLRAALKKAAANPDNVANESITVGKTFIASTRDLDASIVDTSDKVVAMGKIADVIKALPGMRFMDNLVVSDSVPMEAALFHTRLGKKLGMDKQNIVVLTNSDVDRLWLDTYGAADEDAKMIHGVMKLFKKESANGLHLGIGDTSIIIVNTPTKNKRQWMTTFAHEYGHAFQKTFTQYNSQISYAYRDWLKSKGVKFTGTDVPKLLESLPADAFVEFFRPDRAEYFADLLFNGNMEQLAKAQAGLSKWYGKYSEFFAEQFAKWAFSDEVPTTVLGQTFKHIVDGIKAIAAEVARQLGLDVGTAHRFISSFLNDHIAQNVQAGKDAAAMGTFDLDKVPRAPSMKKLKDRLATVTEELKAIEDAEKGMVHGWLIDASISRRLGYDVLGGFSPDDISSMVRMSMGDWALGASSELYTQRVVGTMQESRYQKLLTEYVRPSVEKLSKEQRVLLDNILVAGDKEGRVFDANEVYGWSPASGADVWQAYVKVRMLRDIMWEMRNNTAARVLTKEGFSQLHIPALSLATGERVIGKVVEAGDATLAGKLIHIADEGKRVRPENVGDRLIYRLADPITIDGKKVKHIAVKREDVTSTAVDKVIPYRAGEYKRIYSDEYWVKFSFEDEMDGVKEGVTQAHRTARTKGAAEKYAAAFREAQRLHKVGKLDLDAAARLLQPYGWKPEDVVAEFASGKYDNVNVHVTYNRTDDDYVNEAAYSFNKWSRERGERVTSVEGVDTVNTLSPLDSISSEISNTAYVSAIADWRQTSIHRWWNEFREDLPPDVQTMTPEDAFFYMVNNKGRYIGSDQRLKFAERVQDYVMNELRVPTTEEKWWLGQARYMSEFIEGKTGGKFELVGRALRATTNFPVWLRTVSFHSFFGFNPVQLLVQGMNAFNAVSISPKYGVMAGKAFPLYRIALMSDVEENWRKWARAHNIASLGLGMSEDEFVQTVRAIRRSGLLDGINSTSLYGAETGAYGIFNKKMRRIGDASAAFFNRGEEASRIISFDIARREFISTNPGAAWWTDENLVSIMRRQDDLTQNMTRANTASWQKGAISVPTQFMQYQVKVFMNTFQALRGKSRHMTRKEAAQLLVMHSLFFGVAGSFLPTNALKEVIGNATEELTPEQRLYVQQGVVAGAINSVAEGFSDEGMKLALGSRFNTFNFYDEFLNGVMGIVKGDKDAPTVMELLSGASGGALLRMGQGFGQAMSLFVRAPLSLDTAKEGLTLIGSGSLSTLNNVRKAVIAERNYNQVVDKEKNPQFAITDKEKWAMMFGIPPAGVEDVDVLYRTIKAYNKDIQSTAKQLSQWEYAALEALNNGDEGAYKTYAAAVQSLRNGLTVQEEADVASYMKTDKLIDAKRKLLMKLWEKNVQPAGVLVDRNYGDIK